MVFTCFLNQPCILLYKLYREFLPNANFITANLITAVFQNFPWKFALCDYWLKNFITAVLANAIFGYFISLLWSAIAYKIALAKYLHYFILCEFWHDIDSTLMLLMIVKKYFIFLLNDLGIQPWYVYIFIFMI